MGGGVGVGAGAGTMTIHASRCPELPLPHRRFVLFSDTAQRTKQVESVPASVSISAIGARPLNELQQAHERCDPKRFTRPRHERGAFKAT